MRIVVESGGGCLDEDEVLAFVAGDLPEARRNAVMAHVDACETCRTLTAAVAIEQSDPGAEHPVSLRTEAVIDGRFRLGKPLGKGAMGTVFRARDERLGVDVALKLVKNTGAATKSFSRELHAGRRVTHPNVCRVYDAGSVDGYDYITMELVEGETLADLLVREDLPLRRAHAVIDAICAGLAEAHAQGIVHRDLKPANVMVERKTGRVVLTDFGVATDLAAGESYRLVGTPQYWPPEQARGEPASPASDVYSLGVLAYRILTGRDLKISDKDALDQVPRAFRNVIERCIEHRPADRYKDARQAREAFASAARSASRPIGARGVAILAAIAALAGGVYWLGWMRDAHPTIASEEARPSGTASVSSTSLPVAPSASTVAVIPAPLPTPYVSVEPATPSAPASVAVTPAPAPSPHIVHVRPKPQPSSRPAPSAKPPDGDILYVH
jgi:serine/threonine protein kinase